MKTSLFSTLLEVTLLVATGACLGVAGVYHFSKESRVMLLDRPRDPGDRPDFTIRFFDATGVAYVLDHDFVSLPKNESSRIALASLLSALGTYIDALQEDRDQILAASANSSAGSKHSTFTRRVAVPLSDGMVEMTSQSVPWTETSWHEVDQLLASLESQYLTVAETLSAWDAAVESRVTRFTPTEPKILQGTTSRARTRRVADGSNPVEIMETAEGEPEKLPSANQGGSLAN